MTVLIIIFL